jgi:hypothetical protein
MAAPNPNDNLSVDVTDEFSTNLAFINATCNAPYRFRALLSAQLASISNVYKLTLTGEEVEYPTYKALKKTLAETSADTAIITVIIPTMAEAEGYLFDIGDRLSGSAVSVSIMTGTLAGSREGRTQFCLCIGFITTSFMGMLETLSSGVQVPLLSTVRTVYDRFINPSTSVAPMLSINVPVIFYGEPEQIYDILAAADLSGDTKLGSALYMVFPWIRPFFNRQYTVLHAGSRAGATVNRTPQGQFQIAEAYLEAFTIRMGVMLLGLAYTQQSKIEAQLHSRIAAAYTSMSINPPSAGDVSREYQAVQYSTLSFTSYSDEMLSRVLCIDDEGHFSQDVTKTKIMPLNMITNNFKIAPIYVQYLDQMRLVFTQRHTTSTNFGVLFIQDYNKILASMGERWANESRSLQNVAETIVGSPYAGVGRNLADNLRISNFPRPVLYGLLVYQKTLTTEAEKDEFKKYVTTSVRGHIGSPKDIQIIEAAAQTSPDVTTSALGDIISKLSQVEAQSLLAGRTDAESDKILQYALTKEDPGDWAMDRKKQQVRRHMTYVRETCKKFLMESMEQEILRVDDWVDASDTPDEKIRRRETRASIRQGFLALIKGGKDLEEDIMSSAVRGANQAAQVYVGGLRRSLDELGVRIDNIVAGNREH